ncbi:hypothetical protein FSARC_11163 [Fusarium sarcochroum]|uniref:Epoxide hydrolase N-terminal domain-containing protein n=1 Tax=Fusarium sarcochroum TaxID=1208366 RepID=A0A8H4THQ4_9HYPO|nr:hypothetical protein FSARC_11163 [Fusarium sarcochroum]
MASFATIPTTATCVPEPFRLSYSEKQLEELRTLIKLSKVGPATYESTREDRQYGITTKWLSEAKEQWAQFDWHKTEDHINTFPNFIARVNDSDTDFNIHFVALFSQRLDAVPVLLLHGWPGSFMEFLPILSLLKSKYTPTTLPYHVVVPSLPGYTLSSPPPVDRDFQLPDAARILDKLMTGLGFTKEYVCQGGDIGSRVARVMGATYPRVKAVHLNFSIMPDPGNIPHTEYSELENKGLERFRWFEKLGSAYALEHATKPATIGLTLSSSPLAMLAWIGEKFLDWTDDDPPLSTVLESVTLYWLSNCFSTSLWPYRQRFAPGNIGAHDNPEWHLHKPLGMSWFPQEVAPVPKAWTATTGDLVFFRQHEHGGHFAALEHPDILLKDLEDFVAQVW